MLRKLIKKYTPSVSQIKNNRFLKHFGPLLNAEYLWQINRSRVALSASMGVFIAFLPVPGHMLLAAFCALLFRTNLAVALASVWVANPFTMIPMYTLGYLVGTYFLGIPLEPIELNDWKMILDMWQPLFLGCTFLGALSALFANVMVRSLWLYSVHRRLQKRQAARTWQDESV